MSNFSCPNYDKIDEREFCHDEHQVKCKCINCVRVIDNKLECKGNLHNSSKIFYRWLASLSQEEKQKYLNKLEK